jgi:tape measure domain-containing protein
MSNKAEIIIAAKNLAKKELDNVTKEVKGMSTRSASHVKQLASAFTGTLGGAIKRAGKMLTSLKTLAVAAMAGWGLKRLAEGFIETGSKMDMMRLSLDTITKGKGNEWFEKLNAWALKMPVNTEKAIQSFIMMRAMGLQPTLKDMTTLVDTSSALGGDAGTLEGIARALGQIKTKGKVSSEELMQLAERGVPVFDILREKMGLTAEQLGNIGKQGLDAQEAIAALIEGMGEKFGGQSDKIQNKWAGLTESLKSYWKEFQRLVMESGVMKFLEENLAKIIKKLDDMSKSGELKKWAEAAGTALTDAFEWSRKKAEELWKTLKEFYDSGDMKRWADNISTVFGTLWKALNKTIKYLATAIKYWSQFVQKTQKTPRLATPSSPSSLETPIDPTMSQGAYQDWADKREVNFLFTGTGSSKLPLSEKIAELQGKFNNFATGVSNMRPSFNIDASGASSALTDLYMNQIARAVDATTKLGTVSRERGWYSGTFKEIYSNQVRGAEAGLKYLEKYIGFGGGSAGPVSSTSFSGDIIVNVSGAQGTRTAEDWRSIVRNYIIPELQNAGY